MNDRPLKEIKLPVSKYTAKIVTFYTRGEFKAIDTLQFAGGSLSYKDGDTVMENLPIDFASKQEDKMLSVGIKDLKDENGVSVEVTVENLDKLPSADMNLLILELKKIFSGVDTDDKKK